MRKPTANPGEGLKQHILKQRTVCGRAAAELEGVSEASRRSQLRVFARICFSYENRVTFREPLKGKEVLEEIV